MHQNLAAKPGVTHPKEFSGCCDHVFLVKRFGTPHQQSLCLPATWSNFRTSKTEFHQPCTYVRYKHKFASHLGAIHVATGQAGQIWPKPVIDDPSACVLTARLGWEVHW